MPENPALGAPVVAAPHQQWLWAVGGVGQAPGTSLTETVFKPWSTLTLARRVGLSGVPWPWYTSIASLTGCRPDSDISTRSQVKPALICACVGGHAAFVSDAENAVGTVNVALRLPSAPADAIPSEPRSMSLI